jgi:hypothetical protein
MVDKSPPPSGFLYYRETCELIRKIAPMGCIAYLGWCLVQISRSLAGQITVAEIQVLVEAFGKFSGPLPAWLFGGAGVLYGYFQRREKLRKTTYFQDRIRELETRVDPTRSSSGLQTDGSTNPEDE